MAVLDDITDLAQNVYYSINGAENDDTGADLVLFQNGFIRAFNMWVREYETEAYWQPARVTDFVLATISDQTTYSFDLPALYRTPIFDQNKYLKMVLPDGTVITNFALVDPDQRRVDPDYDRPDRATFISAGRAGGGKVILSRVPKAEEVGAKLVLDVAKMFPKLTTSDGTVLAWIFSDQVATLGIAKNQTLADVTKVTLSPSFTQKYQNELNKAMNANAMTTEEDDAMYDDYSNVGGIF